MINFKKVVLIIISCFLLSSFAWSQESCCENPLGFSFHEKRINIEKTMTTTYGKPWLRKQGYTSWIGNDAMAYTTFFKNDELIGASLIYSTNETQQNIIAIRNLYDYELENISNNPHWIFEKEIYEEFIEDSAKTTGMLFFCSKNKFEKMFISMERKISTKMISVNIEHFLYGVGLREFK